MSCEHKFYGILLIVSRSNGIFVNGKRYRPVDAFGKKSGRPWINGPLGGKCDFTYNLTCT